MFRISYVNAISIQYAQIILNLSMTPITSNHQREKIKWNDFGLYIYFKYKLNINTVIFLNTLRMLLGIPLKQLRKMEISEEYLYENRYHMKNFYYRIITNPNNYDIIGSIYMFPWNDVD
ncbi:hypothetical protein Catovirus_1_240 [Catovirus CTV1]|uniref:Uncharacterized protein n=1 Tax=Catovirus CTV1 TaxID=1977631 RepID=A0A1V0S8Z8_9VIRU|nr:hypothetical protein Catovirus_1_240 [Catovirus CTV1]